MLQGLGASALMAILLLFSQSPSKREQGQTYTLGILGSVGVFCRFFDSLSPGSWAEHLGNADPSFLSFLLIEELLGSSLL